MLEREKQNYYQNRFLKFFFHSKFLHRRKPKPILTAVACRRLRELEGSRSKKVIAGSLPTGSGGIPV